ncbi:mediator of RNA polymerase II transcription subunit 25 [Phoenix dactylifera]|uniref:Mediator of RNA polymerase II transcription subunit 25 n=1 Tax=Phoenix dactylifera TaxID=42345 RepID=A0A8B7C447_PHODC|nr:mediator of RNA polymerase II transcription subunit 25 [Phoenix dactylifera]
MAEKQLIVAVEGTAALGPYWSIILSDYLDKIIRCFYGNELTGQKLSGAHPEFALVVFNTHGPHSSFIVHHSGWTKDLDVFFQWLSGIPFSGGGFSEAAIAEGLAEALMMFPFTPNVSQSHQNLEAQKHCILVAASNPYPLPTPVYRPAIQSLEHPENAEAQTEAGLADAETVAKSFGQCCVSLSVISPKHLPKLRSIYNAGKRNPRAADPAVDHVKNPQFLVLLSESFMEARAALSRPLIGSLTSNQGVVKLDGASAAPIPGPSTNNPAVNGSMINRPPVTVGNIPTATVKMEPTTVSSMVSGPAFPHMQSISNVATQGVGNLQNSAPSPTSQEMGANSDGVQEIKPLINPISQSLRPVGPTPANVSILNNLSQHRQMMTSASIAGASSIGLQTMGATPMAMHMSNMISTGMVSSAMSGITSVAGSGPLMATAQVAQNSALGSFASATSNMSGNSNIGISPALANLQGNIGMGTSVPGVGQGNLASSTQIGQGGISMNQNTMNNLGPTGISSGPGTMIPTPGMSQQAGLHSLGVTNNSTMNMPVSQHPSNVQQAQSKYVKIWEGSLSGQRQGQPVFICKLEGYRNASASETLAADWPQTMQIVRLIAQEHMSNKQYGGKVDYLVFRTLNQHGFLGQLQEKKLCAVIQLPSQTLLLSVSDKAGRLIGVLFPGDMVVFKPQVPSQQQQQLLLQQQQLQPQAQSHQHLQQQKLQQQQLQQQAHPHQHLQAQQLQQQAQPQQQQMVGSGMGQSQQQMVGSGMGQQQMVGQQQQMVGSGLGQTFVPGHSRSQIMTQGKMPTQGPGNMSGGGFLP